MESFAQKGKNGEPTCAQHGNEDFLLPYSKLENLWNGKRTNTPNGFVG